MTSKAELINYLEDKLDAIEYFAKTKKFTQDEKDELMDEYNNIRMYKMLVEWDVIKFK